MSGLTAGHFAVQKKDVSLSSVKSVQLANVDSTREPAEFDSTGTVSPPMSAASSNLRIVYGVMGGITFVYGLSLFVSMLATGKVFSGEIYSLLKNDGTKASSYNLGLIMSITAAIVGLVQLLSPIPGIWNIIEKSLASPHRVNGFSTILDLMTSAGFTWFFAQFINYRDVIGLISFVLLHMCLDVFRYLTASMNNKVLDSVFETETGERPKSYFAALVGNVVATICLWALLYVPYIDACAYAVNNGKTTLLWTTIITGLVATLSDLAPLAMEIFRYVRCDTGCFRLDLPYFTLTEVFRHVKLLWVCTTLWVICWASGVTI